MTDLEKEIRAERNKYNKEWRNKNKDKVKQYNKSYWERRVLKLKAGEINDITTNENN